MPDSIILIILIVALGLITLASLTYMFIIKRRAVNTAHVRTIEQAIEDLDSALNSALNEINKMGMMIKTELDEKYNAMLFLYNLVDDKQKEMAESTDADIISDMVAHYIEAHGTKFEQIREEVAAVHYEELPEILHRPKKEPKFFNQSHRRIWEMRESGRSISEIAKELGIGQGEVKLILDLAERAA